MTTHETRPEAMEPLEPMDRDDRVETAEQPVAERPMETTESVQPPIEAEPTRSSEPVETSAATAETSPATRNLEGGQGDVEMLFADGELSDLRSRWTDVQSAFVDDPRDCVQKADGLVSDVVDQLTSSFSHARSHLEEQWARGEQVSTEDLRIALKRYREFFERLLAV